MAEVKTNNISLAAAVEASLATLPAQPVWWLQEPNDITTFGPTITTVSRAPISKNRQRRKGVVTNVESAVEFETDMTLEAILLFASAFIFASPTFQTVYSNTNGGLSGVGNLVSNDDVAGVGTEGFEHDALTSAHIASRIIFTQGFTGPLMNGLFTVDGPNSTTTVTSINESPGITDEVPGDGPNATMEVAGHRFTDLTWTDATNIIGSAGIDLTTIGVTLGQLIHVGGNPAGTNEFVGGALRGRITAITAAAITLDKVVNVGTGTLDGGGDVGASSVDLHYGQFLRNVPVDATDHLQRSFQFELEMTNLDEPGPGDEYWYAEGNFCNTLAFNLPLNDKATLTLGFIGTDTPAPVDARKTNAATPEDANRTAGFGTSSDIARLRLTKLDESGLTTCFKQLTITLNNNVSPEDCLATLGATFMNVGNFEVDTEMQVLFTDSAVATAVRDNETVTLDSLLRNDDGGLGIDIPAMTLGDGSPEFPVNETVILNLTGQAFADPTLNTSIGLSLFPVLP